jgi:hypothetical protein
VLLAAILIGCASTLPPVQPATSLKSIAGKWEGFITDAQGRPQHPATLVIKEDGTFQSIVPALKESPFSGTIVIEDGKFVWRSIAGKGGFELHEGDGKRVLTRTGQGFESTGEYKPAK